MADKHYTDGWSTAEIASELTAMLVLNLDEAHGNGYDDAEILEITDVFRKQLNDKTMIATLDIYALRHWDAITCTLTDPHLRVIFTCVEQWQEANDD